jgi:hypothetical protein
MSEDNVQQYFLNIFIRLSKKTPNELFLYKTEVDRCHSLVTIILLPSRYSIVCSYKEDKCAMRLQNTRNCYLVR